MYRDAATLRTHMAMMHPTARMATPNLPSMYWFFTNCVINYLSHLILSLYVNAQLIWPHVDNLMGRNNKQQKKEHG